MRLATPEVACHRTPSRLNEETKTSPSLRRQLRHASLVPAFVEIEQRRILANGRSVVR